MNSWKIGLLAHTLGVADPCGVDHDPDPDPDPSNTGYGSVPREKKNRIPPTRKSRYRTGSDTSTFFLVIKTRYRSQLNCEISSYRIQIPNPAYMALFMQIFHTVDSLKKNGKIYKFWLRNCIISPVRVIVFVFVVFRREEENNDF